jgi:hypothetical protein
MDYFILKPDGEQTGTFSIDQIRAMLNSGYIGLDTRYWHEGISDWQPIERIEESLNFPEPSPAAVHPMPPSPSTRLSGSLARAIPSPHQQKRAAPSVLAGAPVILPEKPTGPDIPKRNGEVPAPVAWVEPHPIPELSPTPETVAAALPIAAPLPAAVPAKTALPIGYFLYAFPVLVLALAIIAAIVASRHPARSPLSKVILTGKNIYVLLDQASIKPFEDDMRNSPVAESLKRQVGQSTDPVFIQRINIGLAKETASHSGEITQQYLKDGKAEFIEPGTYSTLAYFDDSGVITVPRAGEPWVAITYHGNIVYAYQGTDFNFAPQ